MAKLVVNSESLVSVADAIREKGGTNASLEFPNGFVDGINAIESGGGGTEEIETLIDQSGVLDSTDGTATEKVEQLIDKAEDENLWYQVTTNTKKIGTFFGSSTIERLPRINFSALTSLSYAFSNMPNLKRIDVYMDTQNSTNFNGSFQNCNQLEYVKGINLASATYVNSCFANCTALKTIEEPIDYSYLSVNSTESKIHMFANATALETIRIVPESIKKHFILANTSVLTAESIQSIIDGLATVETAQTLTLHKDVKILQSQVDSANAKGWTVAGGTVVSEEEYYG